MGVGNFWSPAMINGIPLVRHFGKVLLGAAFLLVCAAAHAEQQFESPEDAVEALIGAAKDRDKSKLLEILGPDGQDVISSGDEVADRNARDRFLESYEEKHGFESEGDDYAVLVLGKDDWPFPIPIVNADGKWQFDAEAGLEEILIRRIGRNELSAIESARAYVKAQQDYAALNVDGTSPPAYAQQIVSSPEKKDGLYWPTEAGGAPSPLTEIFAEIREEGYEPGDKPIPYHSYYFRVLNSQGDGAKGGASDYVVDGRMTGGFALVARPANYGNSGIMTFMVNQDGVVLEKDLGLETEDVVVEIDSFSPDETWTPAQTR